MGQVFEFIGTEGSVTDILSDAPRLQEKKTTGQMCEKRCCPVVFLSHKHSYLTVSSHNRHIKFSQPLGCRVIVRMFSG